MNLKKGVGKIKYLQGLLLKKQISCLELTEKYLKAAKIINKKINAYVNLTEETAIETAKKVDDKIMKKARLKPLEGIPMSLKDNIFTKGIETTCCSKMLKGYIPDYDATVWSVLKEQNAVLLGKTNMDEFAMGCDCKNSCFGAAKNPHNLNRVPGGSSGGSAAAVCANISVYSLGTDTGGSIRQPSSFCGVVGLKPTYEAISRHGIIDFAGSFDCVGLIADSVEDVALVFDILSKKDLKKFNTDYLYKSLKENIKVKKIGLPKQCFVSLNKDVEKAMIDAIKIYENLGVEFVELDMPEIEYSLAIYYVLATSEAVKSFLKFDGVQMGNRCKKYLNNVDLIDQNRAENFGKEVKLRLLTGNYMLNFEKGKEYLKKAKKIQLKIINAFNEAFKKCEIILTPTVATTAPMCNLEVKNQVQSYISDLCTVPANIAGIPAVSVPCGQDPLGMPIGMQLIGDKLNEEKLLNVAYNFERISGVKFFNSDIREKFFFDDI